jgi:hypothetical protein
MPNVNQLNKRLAVYKYDRSKNAAGTPTEGFLFYKYTYGNIKVLSGDLQNDPAPGTVPIAIVEIIVRYDPIIDYNCKIVYGNNSYRIDYIEEIDIKAFFKLRCYVYNENHPGG